MKRTALFVLVALLLMSVTAAAKTPTIGCAIYKFDDTFMTSVRTPFWQLLKAEPK